jgi:hypothetical protein
MCPLPAEESKTPLWNCSAARDPPYAERRTKFFSLEKQFRRRQPPQREKKLARVRSGE